MSAAKCGIVEIKAITHNGIEKEITVIIKSVFEKWLRDYGVYIIIIVLYIISLGGYIFVRIRKNRNYT